jgi:hypothetical protein
VLPERGGYGGREPSDEFVGLEESVHLMQSVGDACTLGQSEIEGAR